MDTFGDIGTLMRTAGDRDRALATQAKGNKALGPRNFSFCSWSHESFCAQSMSIWLYEPVQTGAQLIGDHLLEGDLGADEESLAQKDPKLSCLKRPNGCKSMVHRAPKTAL